MDTYSIFREIADSWGLLAMVIFFIVAVLMLFRPSVKKQHEDAAMIPFRDDAPGMRGNDSSTDNNSEHPLEG